MRVVFRMSGIVAALSLSAATLLTGCGQRGPLYLPQVPPMPQRPADLQNTPPAAASSVTGDVPDTSGEPLSLSPETDLKAAPKPASNAE